MSSVKSEASRPAVNPSRASNLPGKPQEESPEDLQLLMDELGDAVTDYRRKRPGVAGGILFAVGFFVGWRLKPW